MSGLVAVDWGTSSFRLWVFDRSGQVVAESRGSEGMSQAVSTGFALMLEAHLTQAGAGADLPILICGMAGARQGWAEVAYADLPARVTKIANFARRLPVEMTQGRDIRILPGLANRDPAQADVMRGEETQLLGLMGMGHQGLVCMPGTHCKWARLQDGAVTAFQSFMTGELYQLLSRQSILRLGLPQKGGPTPENADFLAAVDASLADPALLTEAFFGLRASGLLGFATPEAAQARLSGLLIGGEIARMRARIGAQPVTLLGQEGLGALYGTALLRAGLEPQVVDAETATKAGLWAAAKDIWEF